MEENLVNPDEALLAAFDIEQEQEQEENDDALLAAFDEGEEDLLSTDPTNTVIDQLNRDGGDITFAEFNNTPEEELEEILESKYGNWLEFDEPILYKGNTQMPTLKGATIDVIQITNPQTGATKDFELGTDYNKKRGYGKDSREAYNEMISWITNQRRDQEGKYINEGARRTLGEDYLVDTEMGQLPLEVSSQIEGLALQKVLADETGELTMEKAIDDVVSSSFGKMNTAWRSSIVSNEARENVKFNNKVEDFVRDGFDATLTEDDISIDKPGEGITKNKDGIRKLAYHKEEQKIIKTILSEYKKISNRPVRNRYNLKVFPKKSYVNNKVAEKLNEKGLKYQKNKQFTASNINYIIKREENGVFRTYCFS